MNSFRSAVLTGQGVNKGDPVQRAKSGKGSKDDDLTSVEVPREEIRSTDHRDDDRRRLTTEKARARFADEEHEVDLINLSGGGAMIRADFTPRLFERVDLILGEGGQIECAVRWLRGDRVGLEFAHETRIDCDDAGRHALLLDVIHRSFPDVAAIEHGDAPEVANVDTPAVRDDEARRAERRHPLIWSGEIHYSHSSERVRLRNISATGALIETSFSLPEGAELLLDLGAAGQIFAVVSWNRGDKAGLRFERQFDLKELAKCVPQLAATHSAQAPNYLSSSDSSPWNHGSLTQLRSDLEGYLKR